MRTKIVIASALLLAGCSAPAPQPGVATLQSAAAPAPSAAAKQVAPVIRTDSSFDDIARMEQPWLKCLKARGVPMQTLESGLLRIDATGMTTETNGKALATANKQNVAACGKLRPVYTPELDGEKNPYYDDDYRNFMKCRADHGEPLVLKDGDWVPGPGWQDWKDPNGDAMELACQAKAFDGKRG